MTTPTSLWAKMAIRNRQIFVIYDSKIRQGVGTGNSAISPRWHPPARNLWVQFCITSRTALCQGAAGGFLPSPSISLGIIFLNCIFLLYSIVASGWDCFCNFIQRKTLLMNLFIICSEFSAGSARWTDLLLMNEVPGKWPCVQLGLVAVMDHSLSDHFRHNMKQMKY